MASALRLERILAFLNPLDPRRLPLLENLVGDHRVLRLVGRCAFRTLSITLGRYRVDDLASRGWRVAHGRAGNGKQNNGGVARTTLLPTCVTPLATPHSTHRPSTFRKALSQHFDVLFDGQRSVDRPMTR